MDIGPIGGIRIMPAIKERPVDPELTAFFSIDSAARLGDDTYDRNSRKAAGAEEPEEEDSEEFQDDFDAVEIDAAPLPPTGQISFMV